MFKGQMQVMRFFLLSDNMIIDKGNCIDCIDKVTLEGEDKLYFLHPQSMVYNQTKL